MTREQHAPVRTMCVTVDIEAWSRRRVPEQLKAQQVLTEVLDEACRHARLDRGLWDRQPNGDGEVAVLPSGIDESAAIADLIREMATALQQHNRHLNDANRVRLRMAMGSGLAFRGQNGFAGRVVIEACRLLDSEPVRRALNDYPHTDLAVIVSDDLYQDVIVNDFRDLRADDFWQVKAVLPGKGFSADAWVFVADRSDGPESSGETELSGGAQLSGGAELSGGRVPPGGAMPRAGTVPRSGAVAGTSPSVAAPSVTSPAPAPAGEGGTLSGDEVADLLDQWRERRAGTTGRGPVDLLREAAELYGRGEFKTAAERYAKVLATDPDHEEALLGLAETLLEGGGHAAQTVQVLDAVIARTGIPAGNRLRALYQRACALVMLGDRGRAISDLEEVVRLVPDPAEPPGPAALLLLGQCHQDQGERHAALQVWNYLLDQRPAEAAAYLKIGRLEHMQNDQRSARAHLTEGLRIARAHPWDPSVSGPLVRDLLLGLSDVSIATGDEADADRLLNQAADADPGDSAALVTLAYRAAGRGDLAATHRLFATALARVPAGRRAMFGAAEASRAATAEGGDIILGLLREEGCISTSAYERAVALRADSGRDAEP
jgi:tetratricopeptide (TPR) repeat protein